MPLSHYVRSLLLSDPQAGVAIAMCAVFVSSFSRHPLESEDEEAAMTAIAAAVVAMMAWGGRRERDEVNVLWVP